MGWYIIKYIMLGFIYFFNWEILEEEKRLLISMVWFKRKGFIEMRLWENIFVIL